MSKVKTRAVEAPAEAVETPESKWTKHRFVLGINKKAVDYNDLTKFEAVSIAAVFVLAVLVGVVNSAIT